MRFLAPTGAGSIPWRFDYPPVSAPHLSLGSAAVVSVPEPSASTAARRADSRGVLVVAGRGRAKKQQGLVLRRNGTSQTRAEHLVLVAVGCWADWKSGCRSLSLELRPQDLHSRGCLNSHGHLVSTAADDLESDLGFLATHHDGLV